MERPVPVQDVDICLAWHSQNHGSPTTRATGGLVTVVGVSKQRSLRLVLEVAKFGTLTRFFVLLGTRLRLTSLKVLDFQRCSKPEIPCQSFAPNSVMELSGNEFDCDIHALKTTKHRLIKDIIKKVLLKHLLAA